MEKHHLHLPDSQIVAGVDLERFYCMFVLFFC